jgi:predicted metal-binding protein
VQTEQWQNARRVVDQLELIGGPAWPAPRFELMAAKIAEKNGEYARHDAIELVAMTDCGDCPGLTVPRVKLLNELTRGLERPIEVLHLGTCVKLAMETAACPIDFDSLKITLEKKFGVQVVLGTHSY